MATDPEYLSLQREPRAWAFWGFSALAHVLLAVILLYTPAKDFILSKPKVKKRAPMRIRGKKLEKFVEKLRDLTSEELRQRVALLKQGQERMADNFMTMQQHIFKDFENAQRKTARPRLEKYLRETLARSTAFLEICNQASTTKNSAKMTAHYPKETAQILSGLEEIGRGLRLIDDLNNLIPAYTKCLNTQYEALKFHRYLEDVTLQQGRNEKAIPRLRGEIKKNQELIARRKIVIAQKQQEIIAKDKERAAARQAEATARKAKNTKGVQAAKRQRQARVREIKGLKKSLNELTSSAKQYQRRNEKNTAEIAALEKKKPLLAKRRLELMTVAKNIQSGTHWQLKSIVEQVRAYYKDGTIPPRVAVGKKKPLGTPTPAKP